MTPVSSTIPYCNAIQALACYSPEIWADMLKRAPAAPRPSYLAMIDATNPAGARLYFHMSIAAGEIESALTRASRYQPSDLLSLTGVSRLFLEKLNVARAMWSCYQFLKPGSAKPEDVPFAKESQEFIDDLKNGDNIFGFLEVQQAGLTAEVVPPAPAQLITPNVVARADRLFPTYGLNQGGRGRFG